MPATHQASILKKAPTLGAFFIVALLVTLTVLLSPLAWSAASCQADRIDRRGQVEWVYDGDTARLRDGTKVRVIGLNTPEMGRRDRPEEPFARKARDRLRELLAANADITLRYDVERHDRYGRTLAHVFLADGRNLTALLLEEGLGMALTVPPNVWQGACYQAREAQAIRTLRGLWNHPRYAVHQATSLPLDTRGYYRVEGRISRVGHGGKSVWLQLAPKLALRISEGDRQHFQPLNLEQLNGKRVRARGWISQRRGELRMRVRHPAALTVLDALE